mgnify:CR=1 FL=1
MTVREQTEKIERETLSPYATLSENTRGRKKPRQLCDIRTEFQCDRDKIIHSKSLPHYQARPDKRYPQLFQKESQHP